MEGCQAPTSHTRGISHPGSDPTPARFWNQNKEGNQELILQPFSPVPFAILLVLPLRPNPTGSQTVKGLVREPEGIGRDTGAANRQESNRKAGMSVPLVGSPL